MPENRKNPVTTTTLDTCIRNALKSPEYRLASLKNSYQELAQNHPDHARELWEQHKLAEIILEGYLKWSKENGTDTGLEMVETEQVIEREWIGTGEGVVLIATTGQKIRRHLDGALLYREWRTVSSLNKADTSVLDPHMRFYAMLKWMEAENDAEIPMGGLHTLMLRSKQTSRAAGPFYRQVPVTLTEKDHHSMYLRVTGMVQNLMSTTRRLGKGVPHLIAAYPSPDDSCDWECPFVKMCPLMDSDAGWKQALEDSGFTAEMVS